MKKFINLALGMLMTISAIYSQSVTYLENFDGYTVSYTSISIPATVKGWKVDTHYVSPPNSYLGSVPNSQGQEVILESPVCDFTGYLNVYLHFKHICKVSPLDTIRLEYRISNQNWQSIPVETYQGEALSYVSQGFSSASYPQWKAEDSTALPDKSWWKEELFDLGFFVGADANVQFRFIIKKGNKSGTQISYGWLLDDIEIIGSTVELKDPSVELVQPYPTGVMYSAGPFPVQAKVVSKTSAPVSGAKLYYTSTFNGVVTQDSILMDSITGTSLWTGNLPTFVLGSKIIYSVVGMDAFGNMSMVTDSFSIATTTSVSVSASLDGFISPVVGQVMGGASVPITVVLHNNGLNDLTTATIHYTVNGNMPTLVNWADTLPWDFTTQVNLANYTARSGDFDTIKVWVSQPNGGANAPNANDTVIIIAYGCALPTGGTHTFGSGGIFPDWSNFTSILQNCPPTSDVTLEFISGTYTQGFNLTNISNYMNGHTLTLTSQSGIASDVTIQVAGTGITLNNSNNIVIKALTINVSSGTSNRYGVNFTGACSNVVVRDCRIVAATSTKTNEVSTTVVPINKTETAGIAHNISFIHNEIDGGYRGINFDGGTGTTSYGTNMVIDSNTITKASNAGIFLRYANGNSISYNTVKSRTDDFSREWTGIQAFYANTNIIGNRIFSPEIKAATIRGLYLLHLNDAYTQDTALISNNEISLLSDSNGGDGTMYSHGIVTDQCKAKIFFNSIYYTGAHITARGISVVSIAGILDIRYNNIFMTNAAAAPIFLVGNRILESWYIDYNNLYAPKNIAIHNEIPITTIEEWQSLMTMDKNTFQLPPNSILDPKQSLQQSSYAGFIAPIHPEVFTDI
ncbi:MAG: hypothetical protein LBL79_00340, partial [Prevotella sp.]|nr:hypothetical protein [Prevotella sp.]